MGVFVDYTSNLFPNLANTPTTLLATGIPTETEALLNPHTLVVNGLIVCNLGSQPIRFNLQKRRQQTSAVEIYYVRNYEIGANQTVDIIREIGLEIFLDYKLVPPLQESLICFSGASIQKFDCEIAYTRLNETPTGL